MGLLRKLLIERGVLSLEGTGKRKRLAKEITPPLILHVQTGIIIDPQHSICLLIKL